ncbi:alpha/beta fold hydrolase [Microbacterium sp. P01]|uniref:alpha/beta fold hydrolase n=1 Tax=unclassified Microbacterium TaxID=2609290 RepID=UPI00366E3B89
MPDESPPLDVAVEHVRNGDSTTRVTRVSTTSSGSTRPFVLVAGIGVASTYFELLAPTLALREDVYALDMPGFAGMSRAHEEPTIEYFADQVEAVLDRYHLQNPVLIGHSMGSQVVTEVLIRRPELTHAILVSPVINEAEAGAFTQAVRFIQSALHETIHLAVIAVSAYLLCGTVYFLSVLPHMLRYRISDRVHHVSAELLLIRGEFDRSSPRRFHSRLVARARDARRWEIEGAAHSIIHGHAVGVAKLAQRHVDGEVAARGRMSNEEAEVPPARHRDVRMLLGATLTRAMEWVYALRRDEEGVAHAKREHARILWRAYAPR